MKTNRKRNFMILCTAAVLLTAGVVAGIPSLRKWAAPVKAEPATAPEKVTAEDVAILNELAGLYHRVDSVTAYEISGRMVTNDLADGSEHQELAYRYVRNGGRVYYSLGDNEMLATEEMFVTVDHISRKIIVSPPGPITPAFQMPKEQMAEYWSGEGYTISKTKKNSYTWIELNRPDHATYRHYRVGFDENGCIRELYTRMANPDNPVDTTQDRLIHVNVAPWKIGVPAEENFDTRKFVRKGNGAVVPAPSFKDYELILTQ